MYKLLPSPLTIDLSNDRYTIEDTPTWGQTILAAMLTLWTILSERYTMIRVEIFIVLTILTATLSSLVQDSKDAFYNFLGGLFLPKVYAGG